MEVKIFEIRDRMTFFPAICIKPMSTGIAAQNYLLGRAGYDLARTKKSISGNTVIFMHGTDVKRCQYDTHWGDRTYQTAHEYIKENWDDLESGEVIDVEFILGETKIKKISEALG